MEDDNADYVVMLTYLIKLVLHMAVILQSDRHDPRPVTTCSKALLLLPSLSILYLHYMFCIISCRRAAVGRHLCCPPISDCFRKFYRVFVLDQSVRPSVLQDSISRWLSALLPPALQDDLQDTFRSRSSSSSSHQLQHQHSRQKAMIEAVTLRVFFAVFAVTKLHPAGLTPDSE